MKKRMRRHNPDSEDSNEKLRGRVRELTKQLETERRYSSALEKKLKRSYEPTPAPVVAEKKCSNCGKGDLEEVEIFSPNGSIFWIVCKLCQHKERKV